MAIALRTPLCHRLGIEVPIFNAGIGSGAGPELAAAVSNAGGFGVIGASGLEPDEIVRRIAHVRTLTDRPFGLNFIIAEESDEDRESIRAEIRAAIGEKVAAVVVFWGDPAVYVEEVHAHGVALLIQVGSVEEAEAAAAAGVDAVIAQGVEAGGHVSGTTSDRKSVV